MVLKITEPASVKTIYTSNVKSVAFHQKLFRLHMHFLFWLSFKVPQTKSVHRTKRKTERKTNKNDDSLTKSLFVLKEFPRQMNAFSTIFFLQSKGLFTFLCKVWEYGDLSLRIFASSSLCSDIFVLRFLYILANTFTHFNWSISIGSEAKSNNEWNLYRANSQVKQRERRKYYCMAMVSNQWGLN